VWGERVVRSDDFSDAQAHLALLQVVAQQTESGIAVHTDQPDHPEGRTYQADYHVRLPRSMSISVGLVNGEVSIEKMSDGLAVELVNGNVACREIQGDCRVALVNGRIDCDVALPDKGSCSLSTTNGNIILAVPDTTSARLEARVTNGSVSVSGLQLNDLRSSRTSVSGILSGGSGSIQATTVNGNIEILGKID
jgi:hypothetical protein